MTNFLPFQTYILRTPALPISFYTTLLEKYSTQLLFETEDNEIIKNAIRLASPELIQEVEKYNRIFSSMFLYPMALQLLTIRKSFFSKKCREQLISLLKI